MSVKKKLMVLVWRMQQSQSIIGLIIWSLTLSGIFYPYIRDKFGIDPSNVLMPMLALFFLTFGCVLIMGLIFDKMRFWKEQNIVLIERNPYGSYKFTARELQLLRIFLVALQQIPPRSRELDEEKKFLELWMEKVIQDDPNIAQEIREVREWVLRGTPLREASRG